MHAARGRPAQMRMRAWPGLCYVRSGWAIDAVHAHRHQRRASRASRNNAHVRACPGPQRAQTPSIGAHSAAARLRPGGCAVPSRLRAAPDPSGVQGRRIQRCTRTGMERSAVHARRTRSRASTGAREGPGSGRGRGEHRGCWAPRGRGRARVCPAAAAGDAVMHHGAALRMLRRSGRVGAQQDECWRGCARGRCAGLMAPGTGAEEGS